MKDNYFKGKKILITGVSGFIGSHLLSKLTSLGAEVYGISMSKANGKNILKGDILDFALVQNIIKNKNINICVHLAGESLVENGQKKPYETFKVNIEGTLNVLESGRESRLEKIIIASTSHIYGKNRVPYYEGYTPRPSRPYETSKACVDLIALSYAHTFHMPVFIPRFVNIYGPGDMNFNRLIPRTIKTVLLNQSPTMWGGQAVRDYLFIDDAIDAYVTLIKTPTNSLRDNRIFNFGGGNKISVKDLIEKIISLSNKSTLIQKIPNERIEEISVQYVAYTRAKKLLNWEPHTDLDVGLKKTILWYKNFIR